MTHEGGGLGQTIQFGITGLNLYTGPSVNALSHDCVRPDQFFII